MSSDIIEKATSLLSNFDLKALNSKQKELEDQLSTLTQNTSAFDSNSYATLSKELENHRQRTELLNSLEKFIERYKEAQELKNDSELGEMASLEIEELEGKISSILPEVEDLTLAKMDNDDKRAIIEIRPGVGGIEAALFAQNLFDTYLSYCTNTKKKVEVFTLDYNPEGGINLGIFLVDESGSYGEFRFEAGVHRVQRVPATEAAGRIHTSTASVVVMPKFEEIDIKINPNDLRIDVYRSTGPGGQSVNTTDSAVRITHIPSKITVTCQNSKSQHKNKEYAMSVLYSRLYEIELEKKMSQEKSFRQSSIQGGDRSAKIRTYNYQQGRVTDHRIGHSWFNITEIMAGGIGEVIKLVNKSIRLAIARNEEISVAEDN